MSQNLYKYPRTLHLPWSEGASDDDKVLTAVDHFVGKRIIITEKMDGENTSMYKDHYHARSLDSKNHPSRNYVKSLWGKIKHDIPEGWRICGENLYAKHSIHYHHLSAYFLVFAIYNEKNECLSWRDTLEWCELLGLETVPLRWWGDWIEPIVRGCWNGRSASYGITNCELCGKKTAPTDIHQHDEQEGYVVRLEDTFPYDQHHVSLAKFVRKNHVQTSEFWMQQEVVPNIVDPFKVVPAQPSLKTLRILYPELFDLQPE